MPKLCMVFSSVEKIFFNVDVRDLPARTYKLKIFYTYWKNLYI